MYVNNAQEFNLNDSLNAKPKNDKPEILSYEDLQAWGPKLESSESDESPLPLKLIGPQLLEQKEKILQAVEVYERSSSSEEPITEEVIEESKLTLKVVIGEVVQERAESTETSYSALYIKRICSILSNKIEVILKEGMSQEKVQLASDYIKYLGEISDEAVLPHLIELDNKKEIAIDLDKYFLTLNDKSSNSFNEAKANRRETLMSRMNTGQLCQYLAALAGMVGCFYCGVESFYKTANTVYNKVGEGEFSHEIPLEALTGILQGSLFFCGIWINKECCQIIRKNIRPAYTDLDSARDGLLFFSSLELFKMNIKAALAMKEENLRTKPFSSLEEASTCPLSSLIDK